MPTRPGKPTSVKGLDNKSTSTFVKDLDSNLIALSNFPDHILLRNSQVIKAERAGRAGPDAQFLLLLGDFESFHVLCSYKTGDPFVSLGGINVGEDEEDGGFVAVCYPHFRTINNPMIAVLDCFGL